MTRSVEDGASAARIVLDQFQIDAMQSIDNGRSVLVTAPTGAGKTIVAEHAVADALRRNSRAIYTSPVKALTNQKFDDLVQLHGRDSVGLVTGDNVVRPDAPVVCMTTEVLRNMLCSGNRVEGLRWVILDEAHYLQDEYRGAVWEEILIHAPPSVKVVCLSATISNSGEFAEWLRTVCGDVDVVSSVERPVELTDWHMAWDNQSFSPRVLKTLVKGSPNPKGRVFEGNPVYYPYADDDWYEWRYSTPSPDQVVNYLNRHEMLPAIFFVFSRAGCDKYATAVKQASLFKLDDQMRDAVTEIVQRRTGHLDRDERSALNLPGFESTLHRGVAVHHAGMAPVLKETVEECFIKGFLRVVFATETLALGMNMPARTVVVDKLTKFDGSGHADLTPLLWTQLSGRAGRRGLDTSGHAVSLWSPYTEFRTAAALAKNKQFKLKSSFRLSCNMVAGLSQSRTREESHQFLARTFAAFQARPKNARKPVVGLAAKSPLLVGFDAVHALLTDRGFLEPERGLTTAGRLLAGIRHERDLLITETIRRDLLTGLTDPELAAVVSLLTYQHRGRFGEGPCVYSTETTKTVMLRLGALSVLLDAEARRFGVDRDAPPGLSHGLLHRVYVWADGEPITAAVLGGFPVGEFIRSVRQACDLLRQISTSTISPELARQAGRVAARMDRGVVSDAKA